MIAANAKMPVSDVADLLAREGNFLCDAIEHHKIVALAVHFGEAQTQLGQFSILACR